MKAYQIIIAFVLVLLGLPVQAAVCPHKVYPLQGEWIEYRQDEFIVQYARAGEHSLHDLSDINESGLPDVIADAVTQLIAMREMMRLLGFQLPLDSPRYQAQGATHILVRFRNLNRLAGRAFDEVRQLSSGECVLIVEVSSLYRSGNLTPAHEFFHQVQNGYTPFKRPWFYEGTARWAETILGEQKVYVRPLTDSVTNVQAIWSKSYDAVSTWYGLIGACDNQKIQVVIPDYILNLRYRSSRKVVQDVIIPGHRYIREVLEQLTDVGQRSTHKQGLTQFRWPEKNQRDPNHDKVIWEAALSAGSCHLLSDPYQESTHTK